MSYVVLAIVALLAVKASGVFVHLVFSLLRPFGMLIAGFFLGVVTVGAPDPAALKTHGKPAAIPEKQPQQPKRTISPTLELLEQGVAFADRAADQMSLAFEEYYAGLDLKEVIDRALNHKS